MLTAHTLMLEAEVAHRREHLITVAAVRRALRRGRTGTRTHGAGRPQDSAEVRVIPATGPRPTVPAPRTGAPLQAPAAHGLGDGQILAA